MRVRSVLGQNRVTILEIQGSEDPIVHLHQAGARTLLLDQSPLDLRKARTLGGHLLARQPEARASLQALARRWDAPVHLVDRSPPLGPVARWRLRRALGAAGPVLPSLLGDPRLARHVAARDRGLCAGVTAVLDRAVPAPALVTVAPWGARLSRALLSTT